MTRAGLDVARDRRRLRRAARWFKEYGLLVVLAAVVVVFWQLNPHFLTLDNIGTLLGQNAALFIVAVGMTFALASQHIDLAPGALIALSGVVMGLVFSATHALGWALAAAMGTAIAVDLFNGLLIVGLGINPLIVTLAAWIWARGLAVALTGGNSIPVANPFLSFLATPLVLKLSPGVLLAALAFLAGAFTLRRTRLGRYVLAMGSDERATRQAGVAVGRAKLLMFTMFGVLAGVGAIIFVGRLGAAVPAAANGLELDAIVAVIIGGNPFMGGEARMHRTLVGALFIAILNNGLSNLGMLDAQIAAYKGMAIILALLLNAVAAKLGRGEGA